jgi:hypothetical protein
MEQLELFKLEPVSELERRIQEVGEEIARATRVGHGHLLFGQGGTNDDSEYNHV